MKLTESKLRSIIREELSRLSEVEGGLPHIVQRLRRFFESNGKVVGDLTFEYEGYRFGLDPQMPMALHISVDKHPGVPSDKPLASATIEEGGQVEISTPGGRDFDFDRFQFRTPQQLVLKMLENAKN